MIALFILVSPTFKRDVGNHKDEFLLRELDPALRVLIKRHWVRRYTEVPPASAGSFVVQSWDTAAKGGPDNDCRDCLEPIQESSLGSFLIPGSDQFSHATGIYPAGQRHHEKSVLELDLVLVALDPLQAVLASKIEVRLSAQTLEDDG